MADRPMSTMAWDEEPPLTEMGEAVAVQCQAVPPTLREYVSVLADQHSFAQDVIVDRRRVMADIAAFWPAMAGWDAQAYEAWKFVDDSVRLIPMVEFLPTVLLRITISKSPIIPTAIPAPNEVAVITTLDSDEGVARRCVIAALDKLPPLKDMGVRAGLIVICQTVPGLINPLNDNRQIAHKAGGEIRAQRNRDPILKGDDYAYGEFMPKEWRIPENATHTPVEHDENGNQAERGHDGLVLAAAAGVTAAAIRHQESRKRDAEKKEQKNKALPSPFYTGEPIHLSAHEIMHVARLAKAASRVEAELSTPVDEPAPSVAESPVRPGVSVQQGTVMQPPSSPAPAVPSVQQLPKTEKSTSLFPPPPQAVETATAQLAAMTNEMAQETQNLAQPLIQEPTPGVIPSHAIADEAEIPITAVESVKAPAAAGSVKEEAPTRQFPLAEELPSHEEVVRANKASADGVPSFMPESAVKPEAASTRDQRSDSPEPVTEPEAFREYVREQTKPSHAGVVEKEPAVVESSGWVEEEPPSIPSRPADNVGQTERQFSDIEAQRSRIEQTGPDVDDARVREREWRREEQGRVPYTRAEEKPVFPEEVKHPAIHTALDTNELQRAHGGFHGALMHKLREKLLGESGAWGFFAGGRRHAKELAHPQRYAVLSSKNVARAAAFFRRGRAYANASTQGAPQVRARSVIQRFIHQHILKAKMKDEKHRENEAHLASIESASEETPSSPVQGAPPAPNA